MKQARYTEEQMVRILREADQKPVAEVAKKHGVSEASIDLWRKKYGELDVTDVRHFKQLEQGNAQLKKVLAERDLEIEVMKEVSRKKWWPRVCDIRWWRLARRAAYHNDVPVSCDAPVSCLVSRDPRCVTNPDWRLRTRRLFAPCIG